MTALTFVLQKRLVTARTFIFVCYRLLNLGKIKAAPTLDIQTEVTVEHEEVWGLILPRRHSSICRVSSTHSSTCYNSSWHLGTIRKSLLTEKQLSLWSSKTKLGLEPLPAQNKIRSLGIFSGYTQLFMVGLAIPLGTRTQPFQALVQWCVPTNNWWDGIEINKSDLSPKRTQPYLSAHRLSISEPQTWLVAVSLVLALTSRWPMKNPFNLSLKSGSWDRRMLPSLLLLLAVLKSINIMNSRLQVSRPVFCIKLLV